MLIKKNETQKNENSKNWSVWEYNIPNKNISYARAVINGRYPDEKRVVNLECEEICFVISGYWIIHSEKWNFKIQEGDIYCIEKNEKYFFEGNNLYLTLMNSPKWFLKQHKIVN